MSASDHAHRERAELSDLLEAVGPDAPTLCEGWTTRDLAAHLIVREARPDAAIGVVGGPTAGWTEKVQNREAQNDYEVLVDKVRTGPPLLSVFSLPGAASLMNLIEYVVHHEDVIRAQPGWTARELPDDLSGELWRRLRVPARGAFRHAATGVTLERTDGRGGLGVVRSGEPMVTVRGSALELLMLAFGRRAVDVTVDGDPDAVAAFESAYLVPPATRA